MTSSNSTPSGPAHAVPPAPNTPGGWPWLIGPLLLACMVIYPVIVYALNDRSDARGLVLTVVAVLLAGAALLVTPILVRHHEADRYHRHRREVQDQLLQRQVAEHAAALQQMSSWRQHVDSGFARLNGYLEGSAVLPGTGELARYLGRADEHLAAVTGHLERLTHLHPAPPPGADTSERGNSDEPDREVLVYVGYRVHSLVSRQLAGFKAAEREEEDPDRLDVLYGLDHLAVQLRRAAGRLAVLGGHTARRAYSPVPMSTVLRQAVTEVEDYGRIRLTLPDEDPTVAGYAGPDVIHVVAELLENATKFSRNDTTVLMSTRSMPEGLVVEICDKGLAPTAQKLEELRRILAAPHLISAREQVRQGQIGILVAARLAARHNLRIELHPGPSGTRAMVVVPHTLLTAPTPPPGPGPGPGPGTPAAPAPELPRRRATTPATSPASLPAGPSAAAPAGAVPHGTVFDTSSLNGATPDPPPAAPSSAAPPTALSAPSSASPKPTMPPPGGKPPLPHRSQAAGSQPPGPRPAGPAPELGQPPTPGLMSAFTSGLRNAQDDQLPDHTGPQPGPDLTGQNRPDDPAAG
ncbi:ATP-binding protein [Spirillospora sp. CA-142024]|uniref:ATP-binding protein n=1 Tax=Spirillospora sp. CA-142024 TaxID=3240036 RepID=UPI003D94ED56